MLTNFKRFKFSKKFSFNIFNDARLVFKILDKSFSTKKFVLFSKPIINSFSSFFWVSNYYATYRITKTKDVICFFKRQRKKNNIFYSNTVDFVLYDNAFFKSIRQTRMFISLGFIFLNNSVITKPNVFLKEGDVLKLNKDILAYFKKKNWEKTQFFTMYKDFYVFRRLPVNTVVSYSTGSICFCFKNLTLRKFWTVNSMEECFFYTEKVSGSNPLLSKFLFFVHVFTKIFSYLVESYFA